MKTFKNFKQLTLFTIITFSFFLSNNLIAQENEAVSERSTFKHAINVCPIAPVFGIYAINYEYLFKPKHGIVARFEYEDVPKAYTDASIESNGWAFSLNYRLHFSGELNSLFLGAYARYKTYKGNGVLESESFDFEWPSTTLGLNGGKRWVWNSGFNLTVSGGYGLSFENREAIPSNSAIKLALDQLENDYDFISPFYGEVSIGYAF